MKRGGKKVSRSTWLKAGGPLPTGKDVLPVNGPKLTEAEKKYYDWIVQAMEWVGFGGKADYLLVLLTCSLAARIDDLRRVLLELDSPLIPGSKGVAMNPVYGELMRLEMRYRDCLTGLYLSPRTRGATKLPVNMQAEVSSQDGGEPNPILRLLAN